MLPIFQKEFVQELRGFSAGGVSGCRVSAMERFKLEEAFAFVAPRSAQSFQGGQFED